MTHEELRNLKIGDTIYNGKKPFRVADIDRNAKRIMYGRGKGIWKDFRKLLVGGPSPDRITLKDFLTGRNVYRGNYRAIAQELGMDKQSVAVICCTMRKNGELVMNEVGLWMYDFIMQVS